MDKQPVNWLEVIKAIGPYVTAIVAVIAVVVTAWLARRNWFRQFLTEKSFALRQEQIRLLQEIPKKLMDAHLLSQGALVWRTLLEVTNSHIKEGQPVSDEVRAASSALQQKLSEACQQLHRMSAELSALRITSRLYFGENTGLAIEAFLKKLQQYMQPRAEITELLDGLQMNVSKVLSHEMSTSQCEAHASDQIQRNIKPITDDVQESISQVIRSMVDYMQRDVKA